MICLSRLWYGVGAGASGVPQVVRMIGRIIVDANRIRHVEGRKEVDLSEDVPDLQIVRGGGRTAEGTESRRHRDHRLTSIGVLSWNTNNTHSRDIRHETSHLTASTARMKVSVSECIDTAHGGVMRCGAVRCSESRVACAMSVDERRSNNYHPNKTNPVRQQEQGNVECQQQGTISVVALLACDVLRRRTAKLSKCSTLSFPTVTGYLDPIVCVTANSSPTLFMSTASVASRWNVAAILTVLMTNGT